MNGPVAGCGSFAIHAYEDALGAAGEEGRHGGAGGGASKEHCGGSFGTDALIREDTEDPSVANEFGEFVGGGFFGEEMKAPPSSSSFNDPVDERVAQWAVMGADL